MRKLVFIFTLIISLCAFQSQAQDPVKEIATEILKGYQNKDVSLLKKHISGVFLFALNDEFFDGAEGKPLVETAKKWNGKIKDIRYSKGDMMGKSILLTSVYFSDNPNGNINVVLLSNYDNTGWKAFALGITDIPRSEFEVGSKEIPTPETEEKSTSIVNDHSDFSIEMANGDIYEKPTTDMLKALLQSLDDENFFLILNSKDGFLQVSTAEKGYIVQYSDDKGIFEAESYLTLEIVTDLFVTYLDQGKWKTKATWTEM